MIPIYNITTLEDLRLLNLGYTVSIFIIKNLVTGIMYSFIEKKKSIYMFETS